MRVTTGLIPNWTTRVTTVTTVTVARRVTMRGLFRLGYDSAVPG